MNEIMTNNKKEDNIYLYSRRAFIKETAFKSSALFILGNLGIMHLSCLKSSNEKSDSSKHYMDSLSYSMIIADFEKCTGCRTCETVCSSFNRKEKINGRILPGLGNPYYSNIKVYGYNPDVDIPSVCAMCSDNPCIKACPVTTDTGTKRKALFRDKNTLVIKNDLDNCLGCGKCAEACKKTRTGVISLNLTTNKPEGMCTLCGGNPQCINYCPNNALSHIKGIVNNEFYGAPPEKIAETLIKQWYTSKKKEG